MNHSVLLDRIENKAQPQIFPSIKKFLRLSFVLNTSATNTFHPKQTYVQSSSSAFPTEKPKTAKRDPNTFLDFLIPQLKPPLSS
jgi:hypothetical protein